MKYTINLEIAPQKRQLRLHWLQKIRMMVTGKDGLCTLLLCTEIHCCTYHIFCYFCAIFFHFATVMEQIHEIPFTLKEVDLSEMFAP
jgi:hypothetical protein